MTGRSILRDASQYTGATYLNQFATFVIGFVTKGLLGPTNVGVWSLLNILLGYLGVSQLGTGEAIPKEVPYLREKGETALATRLGGAMLGFTLAASLVVGAGVVVFVWLRRAALDRVFVVGLLVVGVSFPLWMLLSMLTNVFRAAKRFDVLSVYLVLQTAVMGAVGIPLVWRFSIYGQFAAYVVWTGLVAGYLWHVTGREPLARFRPALDAEATRRLLRVGIPMQLASLVFLVQTTVDSLLAARLLGVTALGYYSLAVTVKNYVYQTPNAFSVVMFPRFQERFAASRDDPRALADYMEKPILGFAFIVLPLLIGASWEGIPFLVRHFLKAFVPAIPAIKMLLIGTFFASLWHMPGQFLIAINKLWQGVAIAAGNALLVAAGVWVATRVDTSVPAVAVGTSIGYAIAFLGTTAYAMSHVRSWSRTVGFLGEVVVAGAVLFVILGLVDHLVPTAPALGPDTAYLLLRSVAGVVLALPLLWWGDRSVGLSRRLGWKLGAAA